MTHHTDHSLSKMDREKRVVVFSQLVLKLKAMGENIHRCLQTIARCPTKNQNKSAAPQHGPRPFDETQFMFYEPTKQCDDQKQTERETTADDQVTALFGLQEFAYRKPETLFVTRLEVDVRRSSAKARGGSATALPPRSPLQSTEGISSDLSASSAREWSVNSPPKQ